MSDALNFKPVSRHDEGSMSRHLFIISRETPYLADYMRAQFSEEPHVEILVDRRRGPDRRLALNSVEIDRRAAGDRRRRHEVDDQLREAFHALVKIG